MTGSDSSHNNAQHAGSPLLPETTTLDELLDAFASQRRRYALRSLCEHERPMALADLAEEVAAREQGRASPEIPADETQQIYLHLYHSHIPQLVEADLVEYTDEHDLVMLSIEREHIEYFFDDVISKV